MLGRLLGTLWGWGAFAVACAVWAVAVIPVTLAVGVLWPGVTTCFERATSACLHAYVRSLPFMRVEVENRGAPGREPRILVANHQSWLDPIVLIGLEPGIRGPARGYLFRVPALRAILRRLGFFPADSGTPASLERLQRDTAPGRDADAFLFFPEGTRSRTGAVAPFHRGAFRLAYDRGIPVQPVVIEGLDRVLPPGAWLVQGRGRPRVRVRYLEPLAPPYGEGLRRDVVRALAARVRGSIADELERMRGERAAGP